MKTAAVLAIALAAMAGPAAAFPFAVPHPGATPPAAPPPAAAAGASLVPVAGPPGTAITITLAGGKLKRAFGQNPAPAATAPPLVPLKRISGTADTLVVHAPTTLAPGAQLNVIVELTSGAKQLVGVFTVLPPLTITAIAPTSGPPGTHVTVTGTGFTRGDTVTLGALALKPDSADGGSLVVTIPAGASQGAITVRGPGGTASSKQLFQPLPAPPKLESFLPAAGPPGTAVKLVVTADSPDFKVTYNERPLTIESRTATSLTVKVPADATASGVFVITGVSGKSRAPGAFTLLLAGHIDRFDPPSGLPGSKVTLLGKHFQAGDEVRFGGRKLEILSIKADQIVVEIPAGAKSGPFTLRRGTVTSDSKDVFQIAAAPTLTSFAPPAGPATTRVVLSGSGLGEDAEVSFGGRALKILARTGDRELTIMIPPGAESGTFTVKTRFGSATSARAFKLEALSTVSGISPRSAAPGAKVTIHGKGFADSDSFFLGDKTLAIAERRDDAVVVTLPADAASGEIAWTSRGVRRKSGLRVDVTK